MDNEETLDYILEKPKSFCRFGDGELDIMVGKSIPFQNYDEKLASRFKEILASSNENCYIGLPYGWLYPSKGPNDFCRLRGHEFIKILPQFANKKRLYIATELTMGFPNHIKEKSEQEKLNYFEKIKTLFKDRKLVIISGSTVFNKIQYNVFEKAASRVHIFANSKNAWSQYEEILTKAKTFPKDYTICAILGPTATILAWDLAQEGYTAWDIGHMAKWYDAFMKEGGITNPSEFFAPD